MRYRMGGKHGMKKKDDFYANWLMRIAICAGGGGGDKIKITDLDKLPAEAELYTSACEQSGNHISNSVSSKYSWRLSYRTQNGEYFRDGDAVELSFTPKVLSNSFLRLYARVNINGSTSNVGSTGYLAWESWPETWSTPEGTDANKGTRVNNSGLDNEAVFKFKISNDSENKVTGIMFFVATVTTNGSGANAICDVDFHYANFTTPKGDNQ